MAIVDQGRALAGQASLTGSTQTLPTLYALPASDFNKIPLTPDGGQSNTAINTSNYNTEAGLGSPVGAGLIDAMVGSTTTSPTPTSTPTPTPTPTSGGSPGRLRTPSPIINPTPTPSPTPILVGSPVPAPTTPLPTPTPASTPPPAPPPTSAPGASHKVVSRHGHHARPKKPAVKGKHAVHRARTSGQAKHIPKDRTESSDRP